MAKEFLGSKGVPYRERDVSRDQAAAHELVAKSGQMGVPVILAEDPGRPGDPEVIVGFDRPRLERLASRVTAGGAASTPGGAASAGSGAPRDAGAPPRLGLRVKDDPSGVLVDAVHAGSLADRGGLRPGDIVLAVDGQSARSSNDLVSAARRLASGTSVELTVRRDGQTLRTRLTP